ncbi:MAG TPA: hypothetical protein VGP43_05900 [Chitinophagaceae bacterium]|nr:hypothetical protein [Chitinophagaceae bacterium]
MNVCIGYAAIAGIMLASCNNNTTQSNTAPNEEVIKPVTLTEPASCYAMITGKDKVLLHITITENKVTGDLTYSFSEKDKNSGTINGQMKGDTLNADYKFMSEGKVSDRQVLFLKNGDQFTEGYGKVNLTTGQPDFTDKAAIKFEGNVILKKTDCNKDGHGCMPLFGTAWSVLKNNCVDLSVTANVLNPIEIKDKDKIPAYVIFSDDKSQAELYLPGNNVALMLERKGKEGNWSWQYQDLKLIPWKGYVLKKGNLAIYGGM